MYCMIKQQCIVRILHSKRLIVFSYKYVKRVDFGSFKKQIYFTFTCSNMNEVAPIPIQTHIHVVVSSKLTKFSDIFLEDLPDKLPLLRCKQHVINLVISSQLPNLSHYKMNRTKFDQLKNDKFKKEIHKERQSLCFAYYINSIRQIILRGCVLIAKL